MQHHILMEGFLGSLKLILKDIKRKLSREETDTTPLGATPLRPPVIVANLETQKRQGVQRVNAIIAEVLLAEENKIKRR